MGIQLMKANLDGKLKKLKVRLVARVLNIKKTRILQ
jgi:hypothetical protein